MTGLIERLTSPTRGADAATIERHLAKARGEGDKRTGELATLRRDLAAKEQQLVSLQVESELENVDHVEAIKALRVETAKLAERLTQKEHGHRQHAGVMAELERRHQVARVVEARDEQARLGREYHAVADEIETHLRAAADAQARALAIEEREDELRRSSLLAGAGGAPAPSQRLTAAGYERHLGPDLRHYAAQLERVNAGQPVY